MYTWVIYDISKNSTRHKIAVKCLQIGLTRVQQSVYLGKVSKTALTNFQTEVKALLNLKTDVLFIVPMSKEKYKRMVKMGKIRVRKRLFKLRRLIFL